MKKRIISFTLVVLMMFSWVQMPLNVSANHLHATAAGSIMLVSVASNGTQGNDHSGAPSISADGRFVAFYSFADNLVQGDINGVGDVFVRDLQAGKTTIVSVASDGTQGTIDSGGVEAISANGRYVVFESWDSHLDASTNCGVHLSLYVHDLQTGVTDCVYYTYDGSPITGNLDGLGGPAISADGRFVAFSSEDSKLVPGDTNGVYDIFVHDRLTGTTELVSKATDGTLGDGNSDYLDMSADGRFIAFRSNARNLLSSGPTSHTDVYIHDRLSGTTELISAAPDGTEADRQSFDFIAISADGRFVAFQTNATNLMPGSTQDMTRIFVHDHQTGTNEYIADVNGESVDDVLQVSLSADGRFVTYYQNVNYTRDGDAFVYDRVTGISEPVGKSEFSYTAYSTSISDDGRFTVFSSSASDLVEGDTNPEADVFVQINDLAPGYTISGHISDTNGAAIPGVSVSYGGLGPVMTDSNGLFTITGLITGTYTLTPTLAAYKFSPASRAVTVPPDTGNVDFTGTQSGVGLTYRPDRDGYRFGNSSIKTSRLYFTSDDLGRMFGASVVCQSTILGHCILTQSAQMWYDNLFRGDLLSAYCDGMSVTSLRFYERIDSPSDFQFGAEYTHDLISYVSTIRNLAYFQVLQKSPQVAAEIHHARLTQTPNDVLFLLQQAFSENSEDLYVVHMIGPGKLVNGTKTISAHAVVPYALSPVDANTWQVSVYDPNHPDDIIPAIYIHTDTNSWAYVMGGKLGVWYGDATDSTLSVVDMTAYQPDQTGQCPWCGTDLVNLPYAYTQASTVGGNVVYTDSEGNQLGYVNNQFISDIPGAYALPMFTDESGSGLTYYLPITTTYTVSLTGEAITQTQQSSYWQFGPDYSLGVQTTLSPQADNKLSLSSDGSMVKYLPNEFGVVSLTLTSEAIPEASYGFNLANVTAEAGQAVLLTNDVPSEQLALSNKLGTHARTFDLAINKISDAGEQSFHHPQVQIEASDTCYLLYGAWDGQGDLMVKIDHGSDGSIDETRLLSNIYSIYLPLIVH
jgi:hypothetical protein